MSLLALEPFSSRPKHARWKFEWENIIQIMQEERERKKFNSAPETMDLVKQPKLSWNNNNKEVLPSHQVIYNTTQDWLLSTLDSFNSLSCKENPVFVSVQSFMSPIIIGNQVDLWKDECLISITATKSSHIFIDRMNEWKMPMNWQMCLPVLQRL